MSTKTVSYILSLLDRASAPMQAITGNSVALTGRLGKMQSQAKTLQAVTNDLGGSLMTLRQRMDLLRAEKDLINPKNLTDLKRYNREIGSLEQQIDKLDRAGTKKGGLLQSLKSTGLVGGMGMAMAAGAGLSLMGGGAMKLDDQFAKVNVTAQMEGDSLLKLKSDILNVAKKNKVDVAVAPEAFEKILSQTNDVDFSLDILNSTLKGSKAGFTDTATVAEALAQSLSIVGKENATANQMLDTFFAAKRVGAGEFKDFATYMPGLIASGNALGLKYKEVAGVFAYMTGKGQSAERASVLMNNMFSMLGRKEVTDKLGKAGVAVFDNGKMRSTVDIFRDLQGVMGKMNDQKKSEFIEKIGVVDKEAKSSFMVMTADVEKLKSSLQQVANSVGETDRALALSANSVQRSKELWASVKGVLLDLGTKALPLIESGMWLLGGAIEVVGTVLGGTLTVLGTWSEALADGNPLVWGLTAALGAAGILLAAHKIKLMAVAAWNGIATAATRVLSRAIKMLNAAFVSSPWGWVVLGIGAVVGVMASLSGKTDKVTKSFAAFNVELSRSKGEAKGSFDAAMQAASGSDARKEAVQKLNEQYGSYLPNLLTEKSSNNELAGALTLVNSALEKKLKLKFRDQARECLEATLNQAETALYEAAVSGIDSPNAQKAIAEKVKGVIEQVRSGQISFRVAQNSVSSVKFAAQDGILKSGVGEVYMHDLFNAVKSYTSGLQMLGVQYSDRKQTPVATTITNNYISGLIPSLGATSGTGIPGFPLTTATTATSMAVPTPIPTTPTAVELLNDLGSLGGSGGGNGSGASNVFDLDQVVTNTKGSTTYNAVVSKLGRVKMAGLAAASMVGLSTVSPALSVPPISEGASASFATRGVDAEDYNKKQKTLNLDKFCDQIVIHIAKADDQGMDEIRTKVMQILKEVCDEQA